MGIEPTRPAWKAGILPLNYTRESLAASSQMIPWVGAFVNTFFKFLCFFGMEPGKGPEPVQKPRLKRPLPRSCCSIALLSGAKCAIMAGSGPRRIDAAGRQGFPFALRKR